MKPKIGIIGVGMVGIPVMRWFTEKGWVRNKNLFLYDTDPKKAFFDDVAKANIVFICVPTPSNFDGSCNTSIVELAVSNLPDRENRLDWCVVIKSTVPPGITSYLCNKYRNKGCFLSNPEFLREARAWKDFIEPDRQIIGIADVNDKVSQKWAEIILDILPATKTTLKICDISSTEAETAKYAANFFGAMKVVFFNILKQRCDALEIDYEKVRQMVTSDKRIGPSWSIVPYNDYFGYGGFCFIKDTDASIASDKKLLRLLKDKKKKEVMFRAIEYFTVMRAVNESLLNLKGLTSDDVCLHDEALLKKLGLKN